MIPGGTPTRSELRSTKHPFKIRKSRIAGHGAFATRRIRKGQRVIEYLGEIISQKESDRRYPDGKGKNNHHTFLFELDKNRVIDASYGGNEARFINHSCDPNCEAIDEEGHIVIFAIRTIQPGEELAYDYSYGRTSRDGPRQEAEYPCYCGTAKCRGSIMEPKKRKRKNRQLKTKTKAKAKTKAKTKSKTKSKKKAGKRTASSRGQRAA